MRRTRVPERGEIEEHGARDVRRRAFAQRAGGAAGCAGSIARSYTLFADPPSSMAATVAPIDLALVGATLPAPKSHSHT